MQKGEHWQQNMILRAETRTHSHTHTNWHFMGRTDAANVVLWHLWEELTQGNATRRMRN